jgi:hypothetical protein
MAKFPRYYGDQVLGVSLDSYYVDRGTAWVIDREKETLSLIDNK